MNLVYIYGKPGVGKLTVSKALARITGYKLFHNHLTLDSIDGIFENWDKAFFDLADRLRFEVIKEAAKVGVRGMIFTFVYANPTDNKSVKRIIDAVERYDGKVLFVMLKCKEDVLHKRIKGADRKLFKKIKTSKTLNSILKRYDLDTPVPYKKSLVIDNTNKTPDNVARIIKKYYGL